MYVQSLPGVILHCEHAPSWHVLHAGLTGCDETDDVIPTGVVRFSLAKTICGLSLVAYVVVGAATKV